MLYQVPNIPYNLTTEHGRAQSYAHGEQGAFLVTEVEKALDEQKAKIAYNVDAAIATEFAQLNPTDSSSDNLLEELTVFRSSLGIRDANAFKPLLIAYSEERQALLQNLELLKTLVVRKRRQSNSKKSNT